MTREAINDKVQKGSPFSVLRSPFSVLRVFSVFSVLTFLTLALTLPGCFIYDDANEGAIIINTGGTRTAPWPPQDNGILEDLVYKVTLSKGGQTLPVIEASGRDKTVNVTVATGTWTVTLDAYYDDLIYATGSDIVNVKSGNNPVTIIMKRPTSFIVTNAAEWVHAIDSIMDQGGGTAGAVKSYVINVRGNVTGVQAITSIAPNFAGTQYVNITINGSGNAALNLTDQGRLLAIGNDQAVTIQNVALVGHSSNNNSLVSLSGTDSQFTMRSGSSVTGNKAPQPGAGVYVGGGGVTCVFTMEGNASISNNEATGTGGLGGGVYLYGGAFNMNGGTISGNKASRGGGVYASTGGTFTMNTGVVYGDEPANGSNINTAPTGGAALYISGGTAKYGNGTTITTSATDDTIRALNGVPIP
ncbi:MAG: hypothetical protein FWG13_05630 [Leptospirales bacterium]|nr:hypothetical protein [Leptospirales bacterium]